MGALSPWARRRKVSLAELVNEVWTLTSDQVIRDLITEAFKSQGLEPPQEKVTASSMLLRSQLLAVMGEPPLKMLRYQQQLSFFDISKINTSIRLVNLAADLLDGKFDTDLRFSS